MKITCLDNLIGVKNSCSDITGDSGININDLPGMTIKMADGVISNEYQSGVEMVKRKIELAGIAIKNELSNFLAPNMRSRSIIDNEVIGHYLQDRQLHSLEAGKYQGIQVRIEQYPYFEFFVNQLSFFGDATIGFDVLIWDLIEGKQIDTIRVNAIADEITTVDVFKSYPTNRQKLNLAFIYDAGITNSFKSSLINGSDCFDCTGIMSHRNRWLTANGVKFTQAATITNSTVKGIGHTSGLSITYSLNCALDNFLCSVKNRLAYPLAYKAGALIMEEVMYNNTRINSFVTIHKDMAAEARESYLFNYESAMKELFGSIVLKDNICFPCNSAVKSISRVP